MSKSFQEFAHQWGFEHSTSSPRYPQSNGKAEATVKSMKKIIQATWSGTQLDEDKLTRPLLQYCNTPSRKDGQSPAQKLFGHPIQDTLTAHKRVFKPEWQLESLEAAGEKSP
jgi:transposase InsO family protein